MSKEISNTLFRMVNMRNPKKVKKQDVAIHFVVRPDGITGAFDSHLQANNQNYTNWQKLVNYCGVFNQTSEKLSLSQVISISEELYDFGVWISRNSENGSLESLIQKKSEINVQPLSNPNLIKIWDNFIYQVVSQEDFEIKEAIIQLLKGNHVFVHLQINNDPVLKKKIDSENKMLFKCKVVFPNLFDIRESTLKFDESKISQKKISQNAMPDNIKRNIQYERAQKYLERHFILKSELIKYQQKFKKNYDKAYHIAFEEYNKTIKPQLDAYNLAVDTAKNSWCTNRQNVEYNEKDPCHQPPLVPYPNLPEFEFTYHSEIKHSELVKFLSSDSLITLYDILHNSTYEKMKIKLDEDNVIELFIDIESFEDLFEVVDNSIEKYEKVKPQELLVEENNKKFVELNGVFMPIQVRLSNGLDFVLKFISRTQEVNEDTIDVPSDNTSLIIERNNPTMRIEFKILNPNGNIISSTSNFNAVFSENETWNSNSINLNSNNVITNVVFKDAQNVNIPFNSTHYNNLQSFGGQINFTNGKSANFIVNEIQGSGTFDYYGTLLLDDDTLQVPENFNAIFSNSNSAVLVWSVVAGASYEIQYTPINTTNWVTIPNITTTTLTITGLNTSTNFRARIQSVFPDGTTSPFSPLTFFSTAANNSGVLATPTGLVAQNITNASVSLSWNVTPNAASYDVYQNNVLKLNVSTNSASIINLSSGTLYSYFVVAKGASGNSSLMSNIVEVQILGSVGSNLAQNVFIPTGFGIKQLGIADYDKVEQSTYCYVEGDVAHIENIMAREFREKTTRRLRSQTVEKSESFESEKEQLSDTTSTDRFEMQSEVAKIIAQSKDMQANVAFSAKWAGGDYSLATGANFATHNSSEVSTSQAITQAKEITERAMDRVVTKIKQERIEKIIDEFEETNSHGFDNRKGDQHVVGVYRWVDKIVKNQIYTYGKRQMIEFMIPEPARLHQLATKAAVDNGNSILEEPVDPRKDSGVNKLENYFDINDVKLKYWTGKYNVEIEPLPKDEIYIGKSFTIQGNSSDYENGIANGEIEIPEGYRTQSCKANFSAGEDDIVGNGKYACVSIGDKTFENTERVIKFKKEEGYIQMGEFIEKVPVSFLIVDYFVGSLNASVKCKLTSEAKTKWQLQTFNAIIKAYEIAKAKFDEQLKASNEKAVQIKGSNPSFYRQIENTVLKQNCIAYMVENNPDAFLTLGKSHVGKLNENAVLSLMNYGVKKSQSLDNYTSFVKFFEQAFEWEIMSYYFYPYYWAGRTEWNKLYDFEDNDSLFRSFMQSGMARVIVTVRPGFEDAVNFYFKTGLLWNGGEVPVPGDDLYISLAQEMMVPLGDKKGKPWRNRLPTSLTILQADSIGLKVEKALPCACDNEEYEDNLGDLCNSDGTYGFDFEPDAVIGGNNGVSKGNLNGQVNNLQSSDSVKVVLRNLQNQVIKMIYLYGEGIFTFENIPVGDYELNFDDENELLNNYTILEGNVKQTITILENDTVNVSLTLNVV